ncbi:MAG: GNAT family N-acetyltransferase [Bdellovibrionaceae bacterium]|nr:GNAT family N-acetyltransferase [Bdellovibrio sp.]
MVSMIDTMIVKSQIYMARISTWKNKISLRLEFGPYLLKVAETKSEVIQCFRLRHEIFCKEMAGRVTNSGLDFDEYDSSCDHLMIIHRSTNEVVGTYRMNYSGTAFKFYTHSEFEISQWLDDQNEPFIELGRACIHSEHRRGAVISLLWRGIVEYMKSFEADKLIGCSSVKVTDSRSAALIFSYFQLTGATNDEIFFPREKYHMKDYLFWMMVFSRGLSPNQMEEAEEKIPSLLKSYIKAGAKVCSYPALDMDFNCIDFMTVLKRSELDEKYAKKFNA